MTYFKAIVTLKNGAHKIIRMSREMVAHIVTEFRKMQHNIFNDVVIIEAAAEEFLCLNDIKSCKFINEYTREELLTLA